MILAITASLLRSNTARFSITNFCDLRSPFEVAVDLRHDVARHHVPAAERILRVGPVVHEANDRAEAAAHLQHRLDLCDEVVRRADGGGGAVREGRLVDRLVRRCRRASSPAAAGSRRCIRCDGAAGRRAPRSRAFSRVSAMCQLSSTRHCPRSAVLPCFLPPTPRRRPTAAAATAAPRPTSSRSR